MELNPLLVPLEELLVEVELFLDRLDLKSLLLGVFGGSGCLGVSGSLDLTSL